MKLRRDRLRGRWLEIAEKHGKVSECGKWVHVSLRLGDAVESIAKPIAKSVDKAFSTKLSECGGCKKRKEMLNRL